MRGQATASSVLLALPSPARTRPFPQSQVLLVGGFGESPHLQARLGAALLGRGVEVVVPPAPAAAVLQGALGEGGLGR